MALSHEFLTERADQAAREAACALPENVRQRALRSEAVRRTMASQVLEIASNRELAQEKGSLRIKDESLRND